MSLIISVICSKCGKKQKMELRNPKFNELNNPILKNKRKICCRCEKSFKVDQHTITT